MIWNHDLSQAPKGKQVTVTRQVMTKDGYEPRQYQEHHIAPVWLARADGKVVRSYWIPEMKTVAGRWSGFAENEQPIAWQDFIVPEHPFQESPRKAAEAVVERPAFTDATIAPVLVEADKAEAVAGVLGQPEMIPALTGQFPGVDVSGPERAGVTAGRDRQPISEGWDGEQSAVEERRAVSGKGTPTATEGETDPAEDALGSQDEAGLQDVRRDTSSMPAVPPCGPKHEVICGQQSGRHEDESGYDPGGNSEVRATLRELPRETPLGRTPDGIAGETATHFMLDDVGGGA